MDIGGVDLPSIFVPAESFDPRLVLSALVDPWPDAVFQDSEQSETHSVADLLKQEAPVTSKEFFVYRNLANAQDWAAHGETPENQNEMLHFLTRKAPDQKKTLEVTIVAGDLTQETMLLYSGVAEALGALSSHAPNGRGKRPTLESELAAAGSDLTRREFYDLVEQTRASLYPDWNEDELVCHPRDSLQFCDVVREKAGAPVPDHLILRALLSRRKRNRVEPS